MFSLLAKHSWGWQYIHLRLFAMLFRSTAAPAQWFKSMQRTLMSGVVCAGIYAPSWDANRAIIVQPYESTGRDNTKPTPVVVNMHGSGFVVPSLGTDNEFCALVAAQTPCVVFDIDYRKAPEHLFPAALQDVEDVLVYIAASPEQFDASNIFVSGFSAGGNLALSTAASLGPERIKGVVGIYAPLDKQSDTTHPRRGSSTG
ncbi:hypothetical protein HWV62_13519 [Athelia sp. TMB]|nr:hypothetical protein HWV62_13519 [Athelia sp. TMB]